MQAETAKITMSARAKCVLKIYAKESQ